MRNSTAQHYRISDIKGRFSFYCLQQDEERGGGRKEDVQSGKWSRLKEKRTCMCTCTAGDTRLRIAFAATEGCFCIVSSLLKWWPLWLSGTVRGNSVADCRLVHFKDQVHFSPQSLKCRSVGFKSFCLRLLFFRVFFFSSLAWQLIISRNLLFVYINAKVMSTLFFLYYFQFFNTDKAPLIQITFTFNVVPLCFYHYIRVSSFTVRVFNVQEREICCSPVLCWITESRSTHKTQSSIIL